MRKTTAKEFNQFKAEFRKWQKKLGLDDWHVYFSHVKLLNAYATIDMSDYPVATVKFNSEVDGDEGKDYDIPFFAKHEAMHLLLGRLSYLADCRYTSNAEITAAIEGLTMKLVELIKL